MASEVFKIRIDRVQPGTLVSNNIIADKTHDELQASTPPVQDHFEVIINTNGSWSLIVAALTYLKAAQSGVDVSGVDTAIALL